MPLSWPSQKKKPVLTRLPHCDLHSQLKAVAELLLAERERNTAFVARKRRWLADGMLPRVARLIDFFCPLCGQPVQEGLAQYLEAFPSRRRLLLHSGCVKRLFKGTAAADFQQCVEVSLLQAGSASGGTAEEIRLLVLDNELELLHSEFVQAGQAAGWRQLLGQATGRALTELYQEIGLLSTTAPLAEILSNCWRQNFASLRGRLRRVCRQETI